MIWRRVPSVGGTRLELVLCESEQNAPRWTVLLFRTRRTHGNPTGETWRGFRDGVPVTRSSARGPRLLSWHSLRAAKEALEALARIDA